jgi:hypothetical protein
LSPFFDQVPSKELMVTGAVRSGIDYVFYVPSNVFGKGDPNHYERSASKEKCQLPASMTFSVTPLHVVSIDEQRKELAVTDLHGARQVGVRGVHSDVGGGYGGNFFEFIARELVVEYSVGSELDLFNEKDLAVYDGRWRVIYDGFSRADRERRRRSQLPMKPTDNSKFQFNDGEVRELPEDLQLHPSVKWFREPPANTIQKYNEGNSLWTYPFYVGPQ